MFLSSDAASMQGALAARNPMRKRTRQKLRLQIDGARDGLAAAAHARQRLSRQDAETYGRPISATASAGSWPGKSSKLMAQTTSTLQRQRRYRSDRLVPFGDGLEAEIAALQIGGEMKMEPPVGMGGWPGPRLATAFLLGVQRWLVLQGWYKKKRISPLSERVIVLPIMLWRMELQGVAPLAHIQSWAFGLA